MLRFITSFFDLFEAPKTYVSPKIHDIFSSQHAAALPFTIQRLGGLVWEQHHYHAYRYGDTVLRSPKSWSDNHHLAMLHTHYLRAQSMTSSALSNMDPLEL